MKTMLVNALESQTSSCNYKPFVCNGTELQHEKSFMTLTNSVHVSEIVNDLIDFVLNVFLVAA